MKHKTRETWLQAAVELCRPLFDNGGMTLPDVQVSCGWPSKSALARKRRRIGECWDVSCAADKLHHVFISPCLSEVASPDGVLATLVHELGHAAVGIPAGHRAPFKKMMKAVGLAGKATATIAGPELLVKLETIAKTLGDYPHGRLDRNASSAPKTQGTRLLKCECDECGYTVRVTKKWLEFGTPICPCNEKPMTAAEHGEGGDE